MMPGLDDAARQLSARNSPAGEQNNIVPLLNEESEEEIGI